MSQITKSPCDISTHAIPGLLEMVHGWDAANVVFVVIQYLFLNKNKNPKIVAFLGEANVQMFDMKNNV
jgi:hypothetical protein